MGMYYGKLEKAECVTVSASLIWLRHPFPFENMQCVCSLRKQEKLSTMLLFPLLVIH